MTSIFSQPGKLMRFKLTVLEKCVPSERLKFLDQPYNSTSPKSDCGGGGGGGEYMDFSQAHF